MHQSMEKIFKNIVDLVMRRSFGGTCRADYCITQYIAYDKTTSEKKMCCANPNATEKCLHRIIASTICSERVLRHFFSSTETRICDRERRRVNGESEKADAFSLYFFHRHIACSAAHKVRMASCSNRNITMSFLPLMVAMTDHEKIFIFFFRQCSEDAL